MLLTTFILHLCGMMNRNLFLKISTHFWSYITTLLECWSFHTCTLGSCLGNGYNYILKAVLGKHRKCTSYRATSGATLSITLCWWLKVWTITLTVDVWSVVMFPYLSILKWWILVLCCTSINQDLNTLQHSQALVLIQLWNHIPKEHKLSVWYFWVW